MGLVDRQELARQGDFMADLIALRMWRLVQRRMALHAVVAVLALSASVIPAFAIADTTLHLNIPAQDLGSALKAFGAAVKEQVLFSDTVVAGRRSVRVEGEYTTGAALSLLLKGSDLKADRTRSGVLLIRPATDTTGGAEPVPYPDYHRGGAKNPSGTMRLAQATDTPSDSPQAALAAEETRAPGSQKPDSAPDALQEIVVTAQKRVQNVNDVGLSIAVLSGEALQERNISSLADLAAAVPGLSYTQSGANTPVYTLRGVGFYETSLGAYPDVTVYVDEAPLPFPAMTTLSAFDLSRVEVLKGPQGTLFGQNATGGALNYIAAKPLDHFASGIDVGYGAYKTFTAEGFVTGPITEELSVRLAAKFTDGGDWQRSYRTGETTGAAHQRAARLLFDWKALETLRIQVSLNGWKDTSDPQAIQYVAYSPQFAVPNPIVGYPFPPNTDRAADFSTDLDHHTAPYPCFSLNKITTCGPDSVPAIDDRLLQAVLRADADLTSDITLTSLAAYSDYRHHQAFDGDGLTLNGFDVPVDEGYIKSLSEELRLAKATGPWRWVVGANFSRDVVFQNFLLDFAQSSVNSGAGITDGGNYADQQMKNYAGFANGEFDIGKFTLSGGLRYTEAKRHYLGCTFVTPGSGEPELFTGISDLLRSEHGLGPIAPLQPFDCENLDATGTPTRIDSALDQHNVSYRAGLNYKPVEDSLLYFNVTKGYKAGSFPAVAASTTLQVEPVTQESVLSFEGGVKSRLFGGRLQADAAAFYYDYKDKQLRSKLIDPIFGLLDDLVNIPKSTVKGLELELNGRATSRISAYVNFTYLDAKIDEYTGINAGGQSANFSGATVPYTPKFQVSAGPEYNWMLSNGMTLFAAADVTYRSSTTAIVGGGGSLTPLATIANLADPYRIDSYALLDLRAGLISSDSRWRVQLWGKNVTNEYYWTNVVAFYDTIGRYTGRPATYGASFSYQIR
jgi:iron complex outermembrane receptor protein